MTVIWAPTDVANHYVGTEQRERAMGTPYVPLPKITEMSCKFTVEPGPCMCGPGIACHGNFGWDGMAPDLFIARDDWIVKGTQELYSVCKQRGLTHLIYMGFHTNACLFGKREGVRYMAPLGFKCFLARDLTDAITLYDPEKGYTPDDGTAQIVADLERAGLPTLNFANELQRYGEWDENWIVDPVRITPWGTKPRPYFFEDGVTVTLTAPLLEGAEIRYALDGHEPRPDSDLYTKPLRLDQTTQLAAAAFRKGARVSLESHGYFVHLGTMPPRPDVFLDEIQPLSKPFEMAPKLNRAYNGGELSIRDRKYTRGVGAIAPAFLLYDVQPEWERFVALAGIDDDPFRQSEQAWYLGMHSSVQFQVYIDGKLASESPIMRIVQEPWRFDVKIPDGSRRINLVITDAGSRSMLDLGDWVDAGFVMKK
jgi:hypothetical protein